MSESRENLLQGLNYGIMTGMPDGTFSGTRTVTRAQACAVLNRLSAAVDNYG